MTCSGSRNRSRAKASGSAASSFLASSRVTRRHCEERSDEAIQPLQHCSELLRSARNDELQLRQGDALLPHIFTGAVSVAHFAGLVPLQEQELARTLVGVDLRR